jgi:hypothetical protein
MITEGIPGQLAYMPMILMCVVPAMSKDEIGIDTVLQRFEP